MCLCVFLLHNHTVTETGAERQTYGVRLIRAFFPFGNEHLIGPQKAVELALKKNVTTFFVKLQRLNEIAVL